jgi:hypothetical protein
VAVEEFIDLSNSAFNSIVLERISIAFADNTRVVELVQEAENNQKEADAKKAQEASSENDTEAGSDSKSEA